MIDGRNGVEKMRGKRNVAREKVESSNECFGVLLLVLFLLFIHGYGGRERECNGAVFFNKYLKLNQLIS
jgi:hypothetical protein